MSHKTFHEHGATEVRVTVLQTLDLEKVAQANPKRDEENVAAYKARISALAASELALKRVDFHIFQADEFLPESMQDLFEAAENGGKYELIFNDEELIKTVAQLQSENPQQKKEEAEDYQVRIQKLFDAQTSK